MSENVSGRSMSYLRSTLVLLSALLCATLLVLWIRSYRVCDRAGPYLTEQALPPSSWRHTEWYGCESVRGSFGCFRFWALQTMKTGTDVVGQPLDQPIEDWKFGWTWRRAESDHQVFEHWTGTAPVRRWRRFTIVGFAATGYGLYYSVRGFAAPHWLFALPTAIPPALWLRRRLIVLHRRRRGRCLACGYDLRGITGGACPECGASIGAAGGASPVG